MNPCPKTPTKRIKPRRVKDPKHLARVAELPCCVCGLSPVEVHHIRVHGGMGRKAGDDEVIPLCARHHRTGPLGVAFHAGHRAWEAAYGTQLEFLAQTRRELNNRHTERCWKIISDTLSQPNRMLETMEIEG